MSVFKGAAVAICTPFHPNGDVDYDKFREQIEYQIAGGTDAIVVCGTTGEASCLSHEEHLECIRFCAEVVDHRIPVIAGTGSNCTETAIYLSTEAEKYGVDALLVVTPYYNKSTQKGLIEHYKMVAGSVKIPIIIYNVPGRTGCNILPATVATLVHDVPNIVGIKEASGNISQIAKLMNLCGDELELYSGNDDQIVPILSLGGLGVISVLSNVAPRKTHDICQAFFDNDPALAAKRQLDAIPLCNALFCEVNPIPVKKGLELQGRDRGVLRRPLCEMESENAQTLKKAMEDYGVL
ncbi:MAG: 4-hydroxy-tetrahydrodipicolinate synthase [Lachnospiraceae bacterium]|nr:4-hydroxy-tetrahydrodipicolinate synthase [Lachnospiraceae bacterium]